MSVDAVIEHLTVLNITWGAGGKGEGGRGGGGEGGVYFCFVFIFGQEILFFFLGHSEACNVLVIPLRPPSIVMEV